MAENEEKVFPYYFYLPQQARMEIIDSMNTADRCRFTRCSMLCKIEAKSSKNYIHSLEFYCNSQNSLRISIYHETPPMTHHGFTLFFGERSGNKYMIYETFRPPIYSELLENVLDSSTDLLQYALSSFKGYLSFYQNTIKRLYISNPSSLSDKRVNLGDIGLAIDSLNNLEDLEIDFDVEIENIFPKLRKPLKRLRVIDRSINSRLSNVEQVYQVTNELCLPQTSLNSKQFSQLSAKIVAVSIGSVPERDIFQFIRAWQNGTIGRDIERYELLFKDSKFNIHKLLNLLRVHNHSEAFGMEGAEIRNYIEPSRSATLWCSKSQLDFDTYMARDD